MNILLMVIKEMAMILYTVVVVAVWIITYVISLPIQIIINCIIEKVRKYQKDETEPEKTDDTEEENHDRDQS